MTDIPTKEMFSNQLNTNFGIQLDSPNKVELQLREVNVGITSPRNEQFALVFVGPQAPFLPQAIYHLVHETLGELDLFLVPVGKDQSGFQYEAVFNRFIES